jgi:hypothetical protein
MCDFSAYQVTSKLLGDRPWDVADLLTKHIVHPDGIPIVLGSKCLASTTPLGGYERTNLVIRLTMTDHDFAS